jgi:N6-adenosine-specific RNA methylase IME4
MTKPQLVAIDPPWLWSARSPKGEDRSPKYDRMTIEELRTLPIRDFLDTNAVVLLWVIDPMLDQCMSVVDAWGLKFKTVAFYWTKTKPSGALHMGGGYYTRANPEQCWLLSKGTGLSRAHADVRRWINAPVGRHSEKPEEFFLRAERLFGDVSRAELFARKPRPGWLTIGNEIDGQDIRTVLRNSSETT